MTDPWDVPIDAEGSAASDDDLIVRPPLWMLGVAASLAVLAGVLSMTDAWSTWIVGYLAGLAGFTVAVLFKRRDGRLRFDHRYLRSPAGPVALRVVLVVTIVALVLATFPIAEELARP